MSEKILDIKEERLSFFTPAGEVKALNGVSFTMNQGDVLGVVGESGSGKSVTAYSVMGLTAYPGKLVGGKVWFNGHEIENMKEKDFRKIRGNEVSIIFQDPMTSLNPVYTIGNQIVEVIRLHTDKNKADAWARAKELLELVGINEPEKRLKQYPHELSGGMRQRVMIAIALACEPKLLIADEPTTALDVTIQAQILQLIRDLQKELGMSVIYITHDLGVVANVADRVAVMYAGQIVEYGTVEEIFYDAWHPYTWALLQALPQLGGLFIIGSKNALFYFQNFHVVHGGAPYMCLSRYTLVNSLTSGWRKRNVKRRFWYSRQIGQKEAGRMTERRHTACKER